jgi:hypothetical protein
MRQTTIGALGEHGGALTEAACGPAEANDQDGAAQARTSVV